MSAMRPCLLLSAIASVCAAAGPSCPADAKAPTSCSANHTCCGDKFSNTNYGCCTLPDAVCCGDGSTCCPSGAQCTKSGCAPLTPEFDCGPVQGENCTVSYVCHPGPISWEGNGSLLVIGDSVSIGYTPHLAKKLTQPVVHSPGAGDGGARSTSAALHCIDYYLSEAAGDELVFTERDTIIFNFGLHDYNLGLAGADQYIEELAQVVQRLQATKARLFYVLTSPAHNVGPKAAAGDDANEVVIELNRRAAALMSDKGIKTIDVYRAIMDQCGPVPFEDTGDRACSLCAPNCAKLSVHYSGDGYEFIAGVIADALAEASSVSLQV